MKRLSQEKMIEMVKELRKAKDLTQLKFEWKAQSSNMSEEEREGVDHMFEMMMASKQQLLLRKAMLNEQR